MSNENKQPAAVRVCAISDVECSRGCGTGACKKESAHDHIAHDRKLVAQPDERAATTLEDAMNAGGYIAAASSASERLHFCRGWEAAMDAIEARATQQATKGDGWAAWQPIATAPRDGTN